MGSIIDEMLSKYGLKESQSILPMLEDFNSENEIKEYCYEVLRSYPDLKKEDWLVGLEGGDYIYSFAGNYVFITDDIWSFDILARQEVLELIINKVRALKKGESPHHH